MPLAASLMFKHTWISLLSMAVVSSLYIANWAYAEDGYATVALNIRETPNGKDIGTLAASSASKLNETFKILPNPESHKNYRPGWFLIERSNGQTGWVYQGRNKNWVKPLSSQTTVTPAVATQSGYATVALNIRKTPNGKDIGTLTASSASKLNETFKIIPNPESHGNYRAGWLLIERSNGQRGWVYQGRNKNWVKPLSTQETNEAPMEVLALAEDQPAPVSPAVEALNAFVEHTPQPAPEVAAPASVEEPKTEVTSVLPAELQKPATPASASDTEVKCEPCHVEHFSNNGPSRQLMDIGSLVVEQHKKEMKAATPSSSGYGSIITSGCTIGSPYGSRHHPILGYTKMHTGQDVKTGKKFLPVHAPLDGKIIQASWAGGYGRQVKMKLANGLTVSFSHLSKMGKNGDVKKGDIIGYVGQSGLATGPHLHLEVEIKGNKVNPLKYFTRKQICGAAK